MTRLTKRYIINEINNLELSEPIKYERYYLNDNIWIQIFEKEVLKNNTVIEKEQINKEEFNILKKEESIKIIRESYLYLKDNRVSIKKYLGKYKGLIRVEVKFSSKTEMNNYKKENWMGSNITDTPLVFDQQLCKLTTQEFKNLIKIYKEK